MLAHFAVAAPSDLVYEIYDRQLRHHAIAQLARLVQQARDEGDEVATQILEQAAHELVRAARSVIERLRLDRGAVPVRARRRRLLGRALAVRRAAPATPGDRPARRVSRLAVEPALGAVQLALAEARGGARIPVYAP